MKLLCQQLTLTNSQARQLKKWMSYNMRNNTSDIADAPETLFSEHSDSEDRQQKEMLTITSHQVSAIYSERYIYSFVAECYIKFVIVKISAERTLKN